MSEEFSKDRDPDVVLIDDYVAKLCEHFDNVQIFTNTMNEGGDSLAYISRGGGNMLARQGQVRDWLIRQEELSRIEARKDEEDDED